MQATVAAVQLIQQLLALGPSRKPLGLVARQGTATSPMLVLEICPTLTLPGCFESAVPAGVVTVSKMMFNLLAI
jgi:hypothetical protein